MKVVKGSHSDLDLITEEASKADIILNAADADDLDLTKAVLAGAKKTRIGKIPILIHTSGTGLVTGEPTGKRDPNAKVYNVSPTASGECNSVLTCHTTGQQCG